MDVTALPFNRFLGLEKGASESGLLVRRVLAAALRRRRRVSARASVEGDALDRLAWGVQTKGRALIEVSVEVVDEGGMVVLSGVVEWFIARAVTIAC